MTVYCHNSVRQVAVGDHSHLAQDSRDDSDDRTWSFSCTVPGCEDRIVADIEFAARSAVSVPLTVDEQAAADQLAQAGAKDVAALAAALHALASERIIAAGL